MSNVVLLYVRDNHIFVRNAHFRNILEQINEKRFAAKKMWLDTGYILIDFDRSIIINTQNAFSAKDIKNQLLRRFSWIDI